MCNDINQIMDMLDWHNTEEQQEKGRLLADNINCLKIFMQPCDAKYNKNVWGNCAAILCKKSDEQLRPYVFDLVEWLQDMNWPGAFNILQRLRDFKDYEILSLVLNESIKVADLTEDEMWLMGISELVDEEIYKNLSKDTRIILKKLEINNAFYSER